MADNAVKGSLYVITGYDQNKEPIFSKLIVPIEKSQVQDLKAVNEANPGDLAGVITPIEEDKTKFLSGSGDWKDITVDMLATFTGVTETEGKVGIVPAPSLEDEDKFLSSKGGWEKVELPQVFQNSTDGLVPAPSEKNVVETHMRFLGEDGKWHVIGGDIIVDPDCLTPEQDGELRFIDAQLEPAWKNYSANLTIGGVVNGTAIGSYDATFTPNERCYWADLGPSAENNRETRTVTWSIKHALITEIPTQQDSIVYNESETSFTPVWSNYTTESLTIEGTTTATSAGTYDVSFVPTSNFEWTDEIVNSISLPEITYENNKLVIPVDSVGVNRIEVSDEVEIEYTTRTIAPEVEGDPETTVEEPVNIVNYTSDGRIITGYTDLEKTQPIYSETEYVTEFDANGKALKKATITRRNTSKTALPATWTVEKAEGEAIFTNDIENITVGQSAPITLTRSGDGAISFALKNENGEDNINITVENGEETTEVAIAEIVSTVDNVITIKGNAAGTVILHASVGEGTNYNAVEDVTCQINIVAA